MGNLNRNKDAFAGRGSMSSHFSIVNAYCVQRLQPSLSTLSEIGINIKWRFERLDN